MAQGGGENHLLAYHLRWPGFEANIKTAFGELRGDQDFADVTLVCGDGQAVAHKVRVAILILPKFNYNVTFYLT